jgi:hypothetical protein
MGLGHHTYLLTPWDHTDFLTFISDVLVIGPEGEVLEKTLNAETCDLCVMSRSLEDIDPLTPWHLSVTAGLAASVAAVASHPMDTAKTRSQATVLPKVKLSLMLQVVRKDIAEVTGTSRLGCASFCVLFACNSFFFLGFCK